MNEDIITTLETMLIQGEKTREEMISTLEAMLMGQKDSKDEIVNALETLIVQGNENAKQMKMMMEKEEEMDEEEDDDKKEEKTITFKLDPSSIKGEKGDKGDRGEKGDTGEKGKDGVDGVNGKDGKDGINGKDGKQGLKGDTPIRGIDYMTDDDTKEIVTIIDKKIKPFDKKIEEAITPVKVRDSLASLKDEERLSADAIKGLSDYIVKNTYDSKGKMGPGYLYEITDIDVHTVTDGQTILWNAARNKWVNDDVVSPTSDKVKTSNADTTRGYLDEKLTVSSPLTKTIVNPGGNETLNLAMPVATSSVDGYLDNADWTTFNNKEEVLSFTSPLSRTGNTVTTSMATNKLIGRGTAGTGVFEEITLGTGLSFSGTTLNATGTIDGSGTTNQITYWVDTDTIGALSTATYPSLTELSYGKGVTSAIQTQIDGKLSDTGDTGTGAYDFGGATTFEIPNSATPTLNATGQIAVDTTVTDFTNGLLKYYSTAEYGVVAMPIASFTSPTNGYVVAYNSTNDAFELVAQSGGGGGGITIGTTTITSGTDTRILFDDGGVVGEDAGLVFNKTQNKLSIVGSSTVNISSPATSSIYTGAYPASITSGINITAYGIGAANSATSATSIVAIGTNACNTITTALFTIGIGALAFQNASPTRGVAVGASAQANNTGTDAFSFGNLSMGSATSESFSLVAGTNAGSGMTVGFWNNGIGGSIFAATGASYGNTGMGHASGQTVGGSFAANRNTHYGYASDIDAGLTGAMALGAGAIAKTSNTIVIGGTITAPTRVYFGLGETSATATAITLSATGGVGTDKAGGNFTLAGGQPSGSGTPGYVYVSTADVGATGTTLRALVQRTRHTSTYFESLTSGSFAMPFAAGSATAPTYSYLGDTNTGRYSDAADTDKLAVNGTLHTTWSTVGTIHTVRNQQDKGADVTAANDLTLGTDGNGFVITGNTTINAITTANWQAGSIISLVFTGTPTVKHNTAGGGGTAVLFLNGSVDLTAANNTTLTLMYDGTQWQELARKVA